MDDDTQKAILQLLAVGAPCLHLQAADRLTAIEAVTPEEQKQLLELVTYWLKTWRAVEFHSHQLVRCFFPAVRDLRKQLAGPPEDDDLGDIFEGELEAIRGAARNADSKGTPVGPSRVAQPGSLDDLPILRVSTEDELRAACERGRTTDPLFEIAGKPFFGYGLRERLYLSRKIDRLWGPKEPDPDRAIMEDFVALITLIEGRLTCFTRARRYHRIAPFVRRWQSWMCWGASGDALDVLEKAGVLVRQRPRTWVVAAEWVTPLRERLLNAWLDACGEVTPTR